ncbi:MAG: hypothetical protein P4L62_02580 [Candidatus Pacebacteria bacterium]|nr:hypothetical protein [Candidatus Paceibacterota bacterium]
MTIAQIFQLLGVTFFALGLGMLANPKEARKFFEEVTEHVGLIYYGGLMALVIGYLLLAFGGQSLVLFFIGWLALLKGFFLLLFPSSTIKLGKTIAKKKMYLAVSTWVVMLMGLLFLFIGFFA